MSLSGKEASGATTSARRRCCIDAYERGLIATALQQVGGNRTEAARHLGISRATFHEKLRKHGLGGE